MKYELVQCIEEGSEIVAVCYNLTADVAIPALIFGFCHCHWHWCSFGFECNSLIITETYKLFGCIVYWGSLSLCQSHEFTKFRGGIVVGS